ELVLARDAPDGGGALEGARGAVEGDQHPVAGRLHLAAAEALELRPQRLERLREQVAPGRVAEARDDLGGADDVGEEKGGQDTVAPAAEARPVAQAGPLDLDDGLVADGVAVVARRDLEHVAGPEHDRRAVGEVDPEPPGDDEADVPDPAPVAADRRADVPRPA